MRKIASTIFFTLVLLANAQSVSHFNFADPSTLTPATATPGTKEAIDLDGKYFDAGNIRVSFEACDYGNTHVRLYGSYDAGPDLRIYDGDAMVLACLEAGEYISEITVTVSLSGGNSDAWFIPSQGEWVWVENRWQPLAGQEPDLLRLESYQQSRITEMTVTTLPITQGSSGIGNIESTKDAVMYYDILGRPVNKGYRGYKISGR